METDQFGSDQKTAKKQGILQCQPILRWQQYQTRTELGRNFRLFYSKVKSLLERSIYIYRVSHFNGNSWISTELFDLQFFFQIKVAGY